MECELCGKNTKKLYSAIIEGSYLEVCEECAKFGKIRDTNINKKTEKKVDKIREKEIIISENAKDILKKYREENNLTREELAKKLNIKVNIIEKLERGITNLELKDIQKIERELGIKLTKEVIIDYDPKQKEFDEEELTVGDIVKIIK